MTSNGHGANLYGIWAIYRFEMARALRTLWQSIVTPVITTALYFVVFGGAIGSRMQEVGGVPSLIRRLEQLGVGFKDLNTRQSSLEDIFVSLVHAKKDAA